MVIRPRFVWGAGDTTLLPTMVEIVKSGTFAWIGGGRQLTDVTHVDNVVDGLLLGAQKGRGGEAYFVTDGEPVVFREFIRRCCRRRESTRPAARSRRGWRVLSRPPLRVSGVRRGCRVNRR